MIIALCGRAHSGKDTAAKGLLTPSRDVLLALAYDGIPWRRVAFADKVKDVARVAFSFSEDQLHGALKDSIDVRWGFTPRHALQKIGQAYRDLFGEDFWIRAAKPLVDEHLAAGRHVVLTDCRYRNEATAVREWGGAVVKIVRDESTAPFLIDATHPSEVELASINGDYSIANVDTPEYLQAQLWSYVFALDGVK